MQNLKAISVPALVVTGLMLIPAPDVAAHEIVYRDYRGHPVHHVTHRRAVLPPWLRQHRDFVNWYSLNYGFHAVNIGWQRLYRRYEGDYYYHRLYKPRHYKARHYKHRHNAKYYKKRKKLERRQRRKHRG